MEVSLNNEIRNLRKNKNLSQAEFAKLIDVSRQTVNSIENGKYDPSLPLAFKIARVFDLRIEELFFPD
mgnify:FL=1